MDKVSEYFSKLGKKSWEVRKQKLLSANLALKNKKAKNERNKITLEEIQK